MSDGIDSRVIGTVGRGHGSSWSLRLDGCDVRFYGWTDADERRAAREAAEAVRDTVTAAEPAATVRIEDSDDPVRGVTVVVRVSADDVAAFEGGPTHVAAIRRANQAASDAQRTCAWIDLMRRLSAKKE
jgi:hypothetical protein